MKAVRLLLPAASLAAAAILVAPMQGFTVLGGSLSLNQRDFRVFNNFTDATANNNQVPDSQFPGHQGAVMAIWKGCVEWGSELHGNGGGDPWQPGTLGSGGANFDPAFAGEASGIGSSNDNIHSELSGTDFGVFAFMEGPISDGWRIRYYQNWTWSDGPTIAFGSQRDIQGIACHEYGHALGLDHTGVSGATMTATTFNGNEQRDINFDDQAGVQFIYGAKSASKPHISSVSIAGNIATINGSGFSATNNEVWFTNQLETTPSLFDPLIKATGVASPSGTSISVTIPDLAGQGDVLVKNAGSSNNSLSNAFPFNGEGPGASGPSVSGLSPSTVEAVNVGPDQIVTITGTGFTADSTITVDGVPLFGIPSPVTFVDSQTLTFDPPLPASLGTKTVEVTNSFGTGTGSLTYVANAEPALQAGDGDEPVTFIASTEITMGGTPGALFFLGFSVDNIPSVLPGIVEVEIGNNFASLFQLGSFLIPASGHTTITLPGTGLQPLTTFFLEGVTFEPVPVFPLPDSNTQELQFLF